MLCNMDDVTQSTGIFKIQWLKVYKIKKKG